MSQGPTREQRELEQRKKENRERQAAAYADPKRQPFRLRMLERQSNLEEVRAEVDAARGKELTFAPPQPRPAPLPPSAEVRLNAASILREDALYKRKQQQEAESIRRWEGFGCRVLVIGWVGI